jgi:hypothetical protein
VPTCLVQKVVIVYSKITSITFLTTDMKKNILILCAIFCCAATTLFAQPERWQQRAEYAMQVDFDHTKHQLSGQQQLVYFNNSPDTLTHVFYHLYFNAFQPNSAMDVRSRGIVDPDPRVSDRISKLQPNEIGYQKVKSLTMNGKKCTFKVVGTILEVTLPNVILPMSKNTFALEFEAQVPVQIRRSGRNNKEGIDYSMAQWYPKMCEYDYQGWHANPYIGREFYGIWGTFDVKIKIDQKYMLGATGILQNPFEIGKGYTDAKMLPKPDKNGKLEWHFRADSVHDFVWAADPDYTHTQIKADEGTTLHFFYQKGEKTEAWEKLPAIMAKAWKFIGDHYGKYPYSDFSFMQGGDGGMEYPMATLVTGERPLVSLMGVCVHEGLHSWYQGVLGTNESLYPWMDEGFTSYAENYTSDYIKQLGLVAGAKPATEDPIIDEVASYARFAMSGREEALTTHSDHYQTNTAYSVASYVKGATFLAQIRYIIGDKAFDAGILRYFNTWKFKHPNANDVIRIFEKQSDLELDWFKEYFVNTTLTIDYTVQKAEAEGKKTKITLQRKGKMPMPLDVVVTYNDGKKELFYIPLDMMRGEKPNQTSLKRTVFDPWEWVNLTYTCTIDAKLENMKSIEIDPSRFMADVARENNVYVVPTENSEKK